MPILVYSGAAILVMANFLQKRKNTWYFRRRIPDDLQHHYDDKKELFFSLKTPDEKQASLLAEAHAEDQDILWEQIRAGQIRTTGDMRKAARAYLQKLGLKPGMKPYFDRNPEIPNPLEDKLNSILDPEGLGEKNPDNPTLSDLPPLQKEAWELFAGTEECLFSEAVELYLKNHDKGSDKKFKQQTLNHAKRFKDILGDRPIPEYRRADINKFRDKLLESGLKTRTVTRYVKALSPIFNNAINELELDSKNPFKSVKIPRVGEDSYKRHPFTDEEIQEIQSACITIDDDLRWLVALVSDTGCRLADAAGLKLSDIDLASDIPNITFAPNNVRRLKTSDTERTVPLIGMSLWAARRVKEKAPKDQIYAFPRYIKNGECKSTHASNTLNNWLKKNFTPNKTLHCFRHSIRDRMRAYNVPKEIQDAYGGWQIPGVGERYGDGYSLQVMKEEVNRIVLTSQ